MLLTEKENHLKNTLILSSCSMLGPSHPPNPLLQFAKKNLLLALLLEKYQNVF